MNIKLEEILQEGWRATVSLILKVLTFLGVWIALIVINPLLGLILGWIPAFIVAEIVYYTWIYLMLALFYIIIGFIVIYGIFYLVNL